jgi:hypothetical protein
MAGIACRLEPPGMLRSSTSNLGDGRARSAWRFDIACPATTSKSLAVEQHPQAAAHDRVIVARMIRTGSEEETSSAETA